MRTGPAFNQEVHSLKGDAHQADRGSKISGASMVKNEPGTTKGYVSIGLVVCNAFHGQEKNSPKTSMQTICSSRNRRMSVGERLRNVPAPPRVLIISAAYSREYNHCPDADRR